MRGLEWLTGVTVVPMPRICGDLGPDPWWTVSRVCVPGDLNPYVSEERVEPIAYAGVLSADFLVGSTA